MHEDEIKIVNDFFFLRTTINDLNRSGQEIRRRIQLDRTAMMKLWTIWKDRGISLPTKVRLVKALIFPVVLYGAESWVVTKADRRKIDAFELWCWRRMLRISWTKKRTKCLSY